MTINTDTPEYGSKENPTQYTSDGKPIPEAPKADVPQVPPQKAAPKFTPEVQPTPLAETPPNLEPPSVEPIPVGGSSTIQEVAALLQSKQIPDAGEMIGELNDTGELSLHSQMKLVDSLGPEVASLVTRQLAADVTAAQEAGKAARNEVLSYAASELGTTDPDTTWTDLQAFANSPEAGLSPQDLAGLSEQLTKGGFGAKLAVDALVTLYKRSSAFAQHADLINGQANLSASFEPISEVDYSRQIEDVSRRYGYDSREAELLRQRRKRSIQYNR